MSCKNCGLALTEETNFCNSCGAKVIRNRLTLKNLLEHAVEEFLSIDNKFLITFSHLFTKPQEVIGGYIDGVRKKYVDAIVYYAIAVTVSATSIFLINRFFPGYLDFSSLSIGKTEELDSFQEFFMDYQKVIFMLLLPLYALVSRIAFVGRNEYNYTEHLVVFLYLLAQTSMVGDVINFTGALLSLNFTILGLISTIFQFIYMIYCLAKLYRLNTPEAMARGFLFIAGFCVLFMGAGIVGVIGGFLFSMINK